MFSARFSRVAHVSLLALLGCGQAPPTPSSFSALSENGTVEATVRFDGGIKHGENTLIVAMAPHEAGGNGATLAGVEAVMPAHGHQASATQVDESDGEFRAELDLFMTGRWQIRLLLADAPGSDSVVFPADVP